MGLCTVLFDGVQEFVEPLMIGVLQLLEPPSETVHNTSFPCLIWQEKLCCNMLGILSFDEFLNGLYLTELGIASQYCEREIKQILSPESLTRSNE